MWNIYWSSVKNNYVKILIQYFVWIWRIFNLILEITDNLLLHTYLPLSRIRRLHAVTLQLAYQHFLSAHTRLHSFQMFLCLKTIHDLTKPQLLREGRMSIYSNTVKKVKRALHEDVLIIINKVTEQDKYAFEHHINHWCLPTLVNTNSWHCGQLHTYLCV